MVSAVILPVAMSTSAQTGDAPRMTAQLAVAMKVRRGTTTSSPGSIPRAYNANSSATVPLARAMACWRFQRPRIPARKVGLPARSSSSFRRAQHRNGGLDLLFFKRRPRCERLASNWASAVDGKIRFQVAPTIFIWSPNLCPIFRTALIVQRKQGCLNEVQFHPSLKLPLFLALLEAPPPPSLDYAHLLLRLPRRRPRILNQ